MAYDERTIERVRKLLSGRRDVVEKKMMGGLCFMVERGMCCSVSGRGGLLVRVTAATRERTAGQPHVQPMGMGGRTMKNFVRVSPEGYRSDAALRKWIGRGLEAVAERDANPQRPRQPPLKRRRKK